MLVCYVYACTSHAQVMMLQSLLADAVYKNPHAPWNTCLYSVAAASPPPFLVLCSIVMSTYTVLQVDTVVGWNVISSLPWYARCTCARIRAINKRWRVIYVGNVLYWSSNCLSLSILIFLVLFYWYVYKRCATASISFVCIHYTSIHQAYCTECISWNFPPIPCWSLSNFAVICTQGRFEVSCITFIWGYRGVIIWAW